MLKEGSSEMSRVLRSVFNTLLSLATALHVPVKHKDGTFRAKATYYDSRLTYKKMANGARYIPFKFTAAINRYPLGAMLAVTSLVTLETVYVTVTDRKRGKGIDLSTAAFRALGLSKRDGWGWVRIREVK
jgi:rare lipoprotein A (peptidoglycan hydrolase)